MQVFAIRVWLFIIVLSDVYYILTAVRQLAARFKTKQ